MSDVAATAQAVAGTQTAESPSPGIGASSPSVPAKVKVKINNVEQEVDIDELTKDYQKYKSSGQKFQEAAELRKQAQEEKALVNQFLSRASGGDLDWLEGLVPENMINDWAEKKLLKVIDWNQMPEDRRRAIIAERKAEERERELKRFTEQAEKQRASQVEQQAYQLIEQDMVDAIKGLGYDYKVTPRFVRRIAEQVYASLEASDDPQAQPMPANIASKHAFKGMKQDAQELLSVLSVREIVELLPPKVRAALRNEDVEEALAQMPLRIRGQDNTQIRRKEKPKKMSTDDRFALLEKKFGG